MGRSPYGNSTSCSKDVSSSGNHSHSHHHHHHHQQHHHTMLKKGAWTPEEDQKLIDYINEHGHGNWRALPKKCGLMRCGKSCRLRWTNYLRPDIKRGAFAPSEEQKIIQLHALVGNRWAFIASQLPKRTDNEIKNYWNTVLKKRTQKPAAAAAISMGTSSMTPESFMGMFAAAKSAGTTITTTTPPPDQTSAAMGSSGGGGGLDINMWMYSMQKSMSKPPPAAAASPSPSGSNHLAQWETARLEAEARLAQQSKAASAAAPNPASTSGSSKPKPKPQSLDWLFRFNLNSSPPAATATAAAAAARKNSSSSIFSFLPDPDGRNVIHNNNASSLSHRHFNAIATPIGGGGGGGGGNNSASSSSETAELSVAAARSAKAGAALQQQQQEGSMKCSSSSTMTSAIKLGSNGRLSWNKHELSLPSLTCTAPPPQPPPPPPPPPPPSSAAASILLDCLHSHSHSHSSPQEDRHDIHANLKPSSASILNHLTASAAENMIQGGGATTHSAENGLSNMLGHMAAPNLHDLMMMDVDTASCSKSLLRSSLHDSCVKLSQLIDSKNGLHQQQQQQHSGSHSCNSTPSSQHHSTFNVLDFYSLLSTGGSHSADPKGNPNLMARSSSSNCNNGGSHIMMDDPQHDHGHGHDHDHHILRPQTQTRNNGASSSTPSSSSKLHTSPLPSGHSLLHAHNLNTSNFQLINHAFDHASSMNQLQGLNFQQIAENLMLGEPNVESQFNNLLMDLNLC